MSAPKACISNKASNKSVIRKTNDNITKLNRKKYSIPSLNQIIKKLNVLKHMESRSIQLVYQNNNPFTMWNPKSFQSINTSYFNLNRSSQHNRATFKSSNVYLRILIKKVGTFSLRQADLSLSFLVFV